MIIPVRCFTCNKVIAHKWHDYEDKVKKYLIDNTEMDARSNALDECDLIDYCCRRMFLSHVNIIDNLLLYSNNPGEKVTINN